MTRSWRCARRVVPVRRTRRRKRKSNLSGAKPWRQKGTGRARAGYKSSRDLAWRRRRFRTEAARLHQESFQDGPAPRFSESAERTDQRRRCADGRQVRRDGSRRRRRSSRLVKKADRRAEGSAHLGFVRRQHLQVGAQCEAGAAGDGGGREHRAVARVRQDYRDAEGARTAGRKDESRK